MIPSDPSEDASSHEMSALRGELERRRVRRYRRRRFARWRRRRLVLRLVAIEFELGDPPDDTLRDLHKREAQDLKDRLARNARRLFR